MKKTDKQIAKIIKDNWHTKSFKEIAELINQEGITDQAVRGRGKRMGLPPKTSKTLSRTVKLSKKELNELEEKTSLSGKIKELLLKSKRRYSHAQLSDHFNVGIGSITKAIKELQKKGVNFSNCISDGIVELSSTISPSKPTVIPQNALIGKRVRFGFVTDNHLGSKYERLDVLNALYDIFKAKKIDTVYNAGNVIDGEARFNKFDIHTHGMQGQCEYFARVYPQVKGLKTYFITGDDHEGWYVQREGVNIGKFMEDTAIHAGRDDLVYLGHMEHDIVLKAPKGKAILRVIHPGGGSSYAYSYTSQKIVESYSPGEKPNIILGGHYHKASYNFIRGVHFVQGGCTMDQSPFMRKKRLEAHVGGWICEYEQATNGVIISFSAEWIPFYGKEFYEKNWDYKY